MHGVTGRMGMNQHLIRSIIAIRDQGGLAMSDGSYLVPDPIIVGRNADKIEALASTQASMCIARSRSVKASTMPLPSRNMQKRRGSWVLWQNPER